jgi:VanZ family protein
MRKLLIYHLPAILYAVLIIYVSSIPNLRPPDISLFKYDKLIHFLEYAVFAVLIYRSFRHLAPPNKFKYVPYLSLLFLAIFALFDEYFQARIPGRDSDVVDAFSDILGGFLIILILHFWTKRAAKISDDKSE